MGASSSLDLEDALLEDARESIKRIVGVETIDPDDDFWFHVDIEVAGIDMDLQEASGLTESRCLSMVENCLQSKNYRNLIIVVCRSLERLHRLYKRDSPFLHVLRRRTGVVSPQQQTYENMAPMTEREALRVLSRAQNITLFGADEDDVGEEDVLDELFDVHGINGMAPEYLVNLLFLLRIFTRYFIEALNASHFSQFFVFGDYHEPDEPSYVDDHPVFTGGDVFSDNDDDEAPIEIRTDPMVAIDSERNLEEDDEEKKNADVAVPTELVKKPTRRFYIRSGGELHSRLVQAILNYIIDVDLDSYNQHLVQELLGTLIVLFSTQMRSPANEQRAFNNPFLHATINGPARRRAPECIQSLLFYFMDRLSAVQQVPKQDASATKSRTTTSNGQVVIHEEGARPGLFRRLWGSLTSILSFPFKVFTMLLPSETTSFTLSDRCAMIFLVLVHQHPGGFALSNGRDSANPFRDTLQDLYDDHYDAPLVDENVLPAQIMRVSFDRLYLSIANSLPQEWACLLLYSLLYSNVQFREYIYSRTDLDVVVLPVLKTLYQQKDNNFQSHQTYMLLIIILILSQDDSFGDTIHRRLRVAQVPWFTEHILKDIQLGSLIMVVLLRTIQHNISKIRDPYLHSNCLAALSNLSPHCRFIHPYTARNLVSLIDVLSRKYFTVIRRVMTLEKQQQRRRQEGERTGGNEANAGDQQAPPPVTPSASLNPLFASSADTVYEKRRQQYEKNDDQEEEDEKLTKQIPSPYHYDINVDDTEEQKRRPAADHDDDDESISNEQKLTELSSLLGIVLDVVSECLSHRNMSDNGHLVYWLVHSKRMLLSLNQQAIFQERTQNLLAVVNHFEGVLSQARLADQSVENVLQVIKSNALLWQTEGDMTPSNSEMNLAAASGTETKQANKNDATNTNESARVSAKFDYIEDETSDEFFIPYIWNVIQQLDQAQDDDDEGDYLYEDEYLFSEEEAEEEEEEEPAQEQERDVSELV